MRTLICSLWFLAVLTAQERSTSERAAVERAWDVGGVQRTALVFEPNTQGPVPVVFCFHGHGGGSRQAARSFGIHSAWPEALVIYPQGLPTATGLDPEGKLAGWQIRHGGKEDRDLSFFDAMLAELRDSKRIDPNRVHVMGHSNGGYFTYLLLQTRGASLASVAPSASTYALVRGAVAPVKVPVLHVAGTADKIVAYAKQEKAMGLVKQAYECAAEGTEWAPGATKFAGPHAAFVALIHDGGHAYHRPASALMVRFFKEHPKSGTGGKQLRARDMHVAVTLVGAESSRRLHTFEHAGVPSLVRRPDGELLAAFQWFPEDPVRHDRIALSRSADNGITWSEPVTISCEGLEDGELRPFDPTLVLLEDGRIRLYISRNLRREADSEPFIGSAISTDGVTFSIEPGARLAISGSKVIDCAVARLGEQWHLYAPQSEGTAFHAVSADGLNFTRGADVKLEGAGQWLGCCLTAGEKLQFFGTGGKRTQWTATSTDGVNWELQSGPMRLGGADPGCAAIPNVGLLVVATVLPERR